MKKTISVKKNVSLCGQKHYLVTVDGIAIHAEEKRKDAEKIAFSLKKAFKRA